MPQPSLPRHARARHERGRPREHQARTRGLKTSTFVTRVAVAASVALTGAFSAIAAAAFPGHADGAAPRDPRGRSSPPLRSSRFRLRTPGPAACRPRRLRPPFRASARDRWDPEDPDGIGGRHDVPCARDNRDRDRLGCRATARGGCRRSRAEVDAIDRACSRFRDDSDLARLHGSPGRWTTVSPLLFEAIEVALGAARATDGAVDPTVGEAVRRIGYDQDFVRVPATGRRSMSRPAPGWRVVETDPERCAIRLPAGVLLDLGATAKALAADHAAARAVAVTGGGVLVSLGGDLAAFGDAPAGGWTVSIADDHGDAIGNGEVVGISSGGLATSSTTVRRWMRGGMPVHHVVDPMTGRPAGGGLADGLRDGGSVRRCEHGDDRGDRARGTCRRMDPSARAPGPARAHRWPDRSSVRLARGRGGVSLLASSIESRALWYLTRGSGAVSLLLLTAIVVLGVANVARWSPERTPRFVVQRVHRDLSLLVLVFIAIHIATVVIDGFAPIRWVDAVVPFGSAYRPIWLGFGALAFDLLLAIAITSLLRARLGYRSGGRSTGRPMEPGWSRSSTAPVSVATRVHPGCWGWSACRSAPCWPRPFGGSLADGMGGSPHASCSSWAPS